MSDLVARDGRVLWHPYTQAGRGIPPLPVASAEGAWLVLEDGRRVLDGISSWWATLHGHGHPRIADAIARQARRLDHVQLAGLTHAPAVELAERLARISGLPRVFYSDDGSTAIETALKMAIAHHARRGANERTRLLALEHGYHGDTAGAMSISDDGPFTADYAPLRFPVTRIPIPVDGRSEDACRAALATVLDRNGGSFAALVAEPLLMGAAGMIVTSPRFLRDLRELTAAHGVLFVADEVFTGFGRTGTMLACHQAGVVPDLLCLGKALTGGVLPLAATLATEEIHASFVGPDLARAFLHGHTFTGNPIGCAAALASLDLLDERALARGRAIGNRLAEALAPLAHHPSVRELRGIGPVRAVELELPDGYLASAGPSMARAALDRGVLLRPLGNVVYALPPLCATDDEVDSIADAMRVAVDAAFA
ncbi:MAG: adenosylmethionine--8-amino-7-oxononanoate transaminase [Acidobacteriota bacterium]